MERFGKGKVVACSCFMTAYIVAFIAIGSFDGALDAVLAVDEIARHDAEWALSASFEALVVVGLLSVWAFDIGSWAGGFASGLLAAFAAGGFHVMARVLAWLPAAVALGFLAGFAMFAVGKKGPAACALLGAEAALGVFQIAFIVQNM